MNITYNINIPDDTTTQPIVQTQEAMKSGDIFTLRANTFQRTGYVFMGWASFAEATEAQIADFFSFDLDDDTQDQMVLYAVWCAQDDPSLKQIVYNANTGSTSETKTQNTKDNTVIVSGCPFIKEGFDFMGWATSTTGNVEYGMYDEVDFSSVSSPLTLYAVWQDASYYWVTFYEKGVNDTDTQDITGTMQKAKVQKTATDKKLVLPACSFSREGYKFIGWSTSKTAPSGEHSSSISNYAYDYPDAEIIEVTKNLDLYAQWTKSTEAVAIIYKANFIGSTQADIIQYAKKGYGYYNILRANTFTKEHNEFISWGKESTSTTKAYSDKAAVYTSSDELILYAMWKKTEFMVTYHANDGTPTPATVQETKPSVTSSYTYIKIKQRPESFTRAGYIFLGWSKSPLSKSADYIPGKSEYIYDDTTFYAVWVAESDVVTITFNANDGTPTPATTTQKVAKNSTATLAANTFTKPNSKFVGWSKTQNGSAEYKDSSSFTAGLADTNVTLYAVWKSDSEYVVTFHQNATYSDTKTNQIIVSKGQKIKASDIQTNLATWDYKKTGYGFAGWGVYSWGSIADYEIDADITPTGDMDLYAIYKLNKQITFERHGDGTETGTQDKVDAIYDAKTKTYKATAPTCTLTKTGYWCYGWTTSNSIKVIDKTVQAGKIIKVGDTITKSDSYYDDTYYPVWASEYYTINYDTNGGSNISPTKVKTTYDNLEIQAGVFTCKYDIPITTTEPTRSGYVFWGWETKKYADGAYKQNYSGALGGTLCYAGTNTTLYAVWQKATVTITYNTKNSYPASIESQSVNVASSKTKTGNKYVLQVAISAKDIVGTNGAFVGWSTNSKYASSNATMTDTKIKPGDKIYLQGDTDLYTMYLAKTDTNVIELDLHGNYFLASGKQVYYIKNTPVKMIPRYWETRSGYTQLGWDINSDATTPTYTVGQVVQQGFSENKKLYAIWKKN